MGQELTIEVRHGLECRMPLAGILTEAMEALAAARTTPG
jgi:hypothetical protein